MGSLPEVIVGSLLVGSHSVTFPARFAEPPLFAAHYVTITDVAEWPGPIAVTLANVR